MADKEQNEEQQVQFLLSDFSTRLRDLEERNRLIKERVVLLGQNLISTKEEVEGELRILKQDSEKVKQGVEKMGSTLKSVVEELGRFVKREEMAVIERMLKDFQPLEFMRKKDVEELIEQKIKESKSTKRIKTSKVKK